MLLHEIVGISATQDRVSLAGDEPGTVHVPVHHPGEGRAGSPLTGRLRSAHLLTRDLLPLTTDLPPPSLSFSRL